MNERTFSNGVMVVFLVLFLFLCSLFLIWPKHKANNNSLGYLPDGTAVQSDTIRSIHDANDEGRSLALTNDQGKKDEKQTY